MHNGKQNSSGLSFNYGSLTYECTVDTAWSVREDYVEFSLDRYPITMYVYENGYWYGSTDDLMCLDRKLALKLEANDAYFLSVTTIYGIKSEIGFLGVTFGPNGCPLDEETLPNKMRKYASQLSPFLDGENVK